METIKSKSFSWLSDYQAKVMSADEAVAKIKSGDSVYVQSNAAAPLIQAVLVSMPA